ncbi:HD domain-containing protein [Hydrogenovibrio sp. JE_KL2]|uniref:HD domain-containing protein n=1 Tax=Hydrogenovibrio sp. JE_KL2 TaxID=2651188 RepID=UPI00128B66F5|nr:HD domain-containing protein [Hydrogenovibrio sp. JE_KL2]MPQ76822.1 HD domain-containing protein [Hydrogenovibrio sp. JE_KL2]
MVNNSFKIFPEKPSSIEDWMGFKSDGTYQRVISSVPFSRLNDISFLGALDYTQQTQISKNERNRAVHSLYVAALANYISTKRNYSEDLKKHLIIAALLHDIGHPPLSHSVEPYTKQFLGLGHHELSENIIRGLAPKSKPLNSYLNKIVDINFVLDLINQNSTEEGSDLFNSPINIDTIDGITRAYAYLKNTQKVDMAESRLKIAEASFLHNSSCNNQNILDEFWSKKDQVYRLLINSNEGLLSDKASELFFHTLSCSETISEGDLYSSEHSWRKQYKKLFSSLFEIRARGRNEIPSWLENKTIDYKARVYKVENVQEQFNRYSCVKQTKEHNFGRKNISKKLTATPLFQ